MNNGESKKKKNEIELSKETIKRRRVRQDRLVIS